MPSAALDGCCEAATLAAEARPLDPAAGPTKKKKEEAVIEIGRDSRSERMFPILIPTVQLVIAKQRGMGTAVQTRGYLLYVRKTTGMGRSAVHQAQ